MKFIISLFLISSTAFAELPFKVFAEPYIEKSFRSKSEIVGSNFESQSGNASTFSLGSKLGLESSFGLIGGIAFDYTSAIVANANRYNASYDLSFQSIDAFVGFKLLDIFRASYARSISGKASTTDGADRNVSSSSNKISLGILLNKKCYLEISRMEKSSELMSINPSVARYASLYDTYSIGLAFPVEL